MTLPVSGPVPGILADPLPSLLSYRPGRSTPCPACGERQWLVGRIVAQCACCDAALPIDLGYRGWSVARPGRPAPTPAA
jgi:hypothetical protein